MPVHGDTLLKASKPDSPMIGLLLQLAHGLPAGQLTLIAPGGNRHDCIGTQPGPVAELHIHDPRAIRRFLTGGMLGFNEAYLDGDWSSPNIAELFEYAMANEAAMQTQLDGKPFHRRLATLYHWLQPNTRRGARRNIGAHYDLGNAFYEHWLDPSMTYSAALFADHDEPLEQAQTRKYEEIARKIDIRPGMRILEIGCGWGGFAEYAARRHGAQVTGITISRAQHDYARARMARAGLDHLVEIRFQDYRDVHEQFDAIVSIEMFEAVGERYWPVFFQGLRDRLQPGGRAALQIITIEERRFADYRRKADYIQTYIFPGGMLPSPTALISQIQAAGLKLEQSTAFGRSYASTLHHWHERFQHRWPEISQLGFDHRFKRMWEQYLAYCKAGFQSGALDVLQVALVRH